MTEQPVEPVTEQEFLGNRRPEAYLHDGHRLGSWVPARPSALVQQDNDEAFAEHAASGFPEPRTDLLMEAEVSAQHGVKSLELGELDAGIAWLQSALAFALNARHASEVDGKTAHVHNIFAFDGSAVQP